MRVQSRVGVIWRESCQNPGPRERRVGAALWRVTEVDGTPQRWRSPAGAEVCGESDALGQRSPQTGAESLQNLTLRVKVNPEVK